MPSSRIAAVLAAVLVTVAAMPAAAAELVLYSGRGEPLVGPLIQSFERDTGIRVRVRYGGTAELAVLLQEEGAQSPADLYWAQDAGALGAVAERFVKLPDSLLADVPAIYRDEEGRWIATSGRGRVLAYSSTRVSDDELPQSVFDLSEERYRGRVGWAPTNGSFQAFVTAMRVLHGDERVRRWLAAMKDNAATPLRNNTAQIKAIAAGEIDFGLVNNYYLPRLKAANPDMPVSQTLFADGDIGNLLLVAGVGVLNTSKQAELAQRFVAFLLEPEAQRYFADDVHEYPVVAGVAGSPLHPQLEKVGAAAPPVDLNAIGDLEGTLRLLRDAGLL